MTAQPSTASDLLLTTKLYIPRVRTSLIARPRLISRLDEALECKLALLCAPGGFGKTSLLSQWARSLSGHMRIGWLSLTDAENDPATFWAYMAAALDRVEPGLGRVPQAMLRNASPGILDSLWMAFINGVSECAHDFVLVLDDYHLIANPAIHRAVSQLIDQMPPHLHLVISGRTEPPLPLARLRAAGELVELRTEELRFGPAEVAEFIVGVKGLGLRTDQLLALEQRTEGWVAGLQMAALSMQGRADLESFVTSFTGSHRFVVDYLGEEVLERQPEEVRQFLLRTAVLERLTGPLCDFVTGGTGGQEMLHRLEQENLFITQLDEHREWYRYHALFAEMLRARLGQREPELVPALHRRASQWHAAHGQPADAVQHALAAGEYEQAADLVEQRMAGMNRRGEWQTLLTWLGALPESLLSGRPQLAIAYAQRLVEAGQLEPAENLLQAAEQNLEAGVDQPETRVQTMRGQVAAIRAFVRRIRRDLPAAVELSRAALELLPAEEAGWRGMVTLRLAGAYHQLGDLEAAAATFAEAAALSRLSGDLHGTVISLGSQGRLLLQRGQGDAALSLYQQAVRLCADQGPEVLTAASTAHLNLAGLLRLRHDLDGAERHAAEALRFAGQAGHGEALVYGHLLLAFLARMKGDAARAQHLMRQAEQIVPAEIEWAVKLVKAWRAQLALMEGNLAEAVEWARLYGEQASDDLFSPLALENTTLLWVKTATGQPSEVLARVARLLPLAEEAPELPLAQDFRMFAALAYHQQGEGARALAELEAALGLAESTGVLLGFILMGAPMAELLRQALPHSGRRELIGRLLAALGAETVPAPPGHNPGTRSVQPLLEPLSERELEVLQLVAGGASNQEIGDQLFIALTTVKKHMGNIFGKLGATNRVQALKRAKELGVI